MDFEVAKAVSSRWQFLRRFPYGFARLYCSCTQPRIFARTAIAVVLIGSIWATGGGQVWAGDAEGEAAKSDKAFTKWMQALWPEAQAKGISRAVFDRALKGLTFDPDVLRLSENQPEFSTPIWDYIERRVSADRIAAGQDQFEQHRELLGKLEAAYGVDRHVLTAIWGLESYYGQSAGARSAIRSLASLGFKGKRKAFGRTQLIAALKILENEDIAADKLVGSWAGAMGQPQFIPTTYLDYAVDFDGDGKRDIWDTTSDALGSAANYLKISGWQPDKGWGYEIQLPDRFDYARTGQNSVKSIRQWASLGVERVRGRRFPRLNDKAAIILPAGSTGPVFLILNNFRVILRYNNSIAYALAICHLADRIAGYSGLSRPWPKTLVPLALKSEREELQRRLRAKGYRTGKIDGIIGPKTRAAVRAYQKAKGLQADGYPSLEFLNALREDS